MKERLLLILQVRAHNVNVSTVEMIILLRKLTGLGRLANRHTT